MSVIRLLRHSLLPLLLICSVNQGQAEVLRERVVQAAHSASGPVVFQYQLPDSISEATTIDIQLRFNSTPGQRVSLQLVDDEGYQWIGEQRCRLSIDDQGELQHQASVMLNRAGKHYLKLQLKLPDDQLQVFVIPLQTSDSATAVEPATPPSRRVMPVAN